jgi:hypothetical protein
MKRTIPARPALVKLETLEERASPGHLGSDAVGLAAASQLTAPSENRTRGGYCLI